MSEACQRIGEKYHCERGMMDDVIDLVYCHDVAAIVCDFGWVEALNWHAKMHDLLKVIPIGVITTNLSANQVKNEYGPLLNIVEACSVPEFHGCRYTQEKSCADNIRRRKKQGPKPEDRS